MRLDASRAVGLCFFLIFLLRFVALSARQVRRELSVQHQSWPGTPSGVSSIQCCGSPIRNRRRKSFWAWESSEQDATRPAPNKALETTDYPLQFRYSSQYPIRAPLRRSLVHSCSFLLLALYLSVRQLVQIGRAH